MKLLKGNKYELKKDLKDKRSELDQSKTELGNLTKKLNQEKAKFGEEIRQLNNTLLEHHNNFKAFESRSKDSEMKLEKKYREFLEQEEILSKDLKGKSKSWRIATLVYNNPTMRCYL